MKKRKILYTFFTVLISLSFALPLSPAYATASPQVAEFLCDRGVSLFKQERLDKALVEFEKALMANPGSDEARRYIELIKSRTSANQAPTPVMVVREQEATVYQPVSAAQPPGPQSRRKVIWRLEKKMQDVLDAVIAEKRLEQMVPSRVPETAAAPAGGTAAFGIPVVPPHEVIVDLSGLDRTQAVHEMRVSAGDIIIFRGERITRYLAVDPVLLQVTRLGDESVRVVPQEIGSTVFHAWDPGGRSTFAFTVGPKRWQEVWARQLEDRRLESALPQSFRLSYSLQGDSFYTGRRIGSARRQSHSYFYTSSATGDTPFGKFDAAVQASRTAAKEYYIPNIRMSLTDAHYGVLKDIDVRWFDFSSSFGSFGFPSASLRGVRVDAPAFERRLNTTAFWGALSKGDYARLASSGGLSKTKEAWLEGIGLSYRFGRLLNAKSFFAHSYGSERNAPVLTSDTWGAGLEGAAGIWNWGAEMVSDTQNISYTARSAFNLPKLNVSFAMTDFNKDFRSLLGGAPAGGSVSGSMNVVYRPVQELTIMESFSGDRDRYFFNPDAPHRPNYNSHTSVAWTLDPHTDVEVGYLVDDRMGSNVPSISESKEVTLRKRLFFLRRLSTYVSYSNTKTKNYGSPAQDFNNNRILAGVSFRLLSELYCYYRKEFNLLRNKFTGERAAPHAQEIGLNYYRQIGSTPIYGRASLYFRDEENTESTLSYLSGQDRLEGEGELTYKPNPDSEVFFRLHAANIWAERQGAGKHLDLGLSWGLRFVWDTGARWFSRGAFNGLVYKDVNGDGRRQADEEGVAGVRVHVGDNASVTNGYGYYYIPGVVGPAARVEVDAGTLPGGFSLTTPGRRDEEVVHMATQRVDFGVGSRTEVSGIVFEDKNGNGRYDGGDAPLEGVVLVLDGKFRAVSSRLGEYMFRNLSPGDHTVALELRSVPVAYIPRVPVKSVVTVFEGATSPYHIPMTRQEK